ncbi:hypothetical protein [Sessilibacter corallicola]|uniref:Phage protein n=1 Tax=Sessilibacter corallicola TaxID=2904075 RepID=A0ABQ0ACP6_9GAMM
MDLSIKEKVLSLAAFNKYMKYLESELSSGNLDEEEYSHMANDAALLEILISRFEDEVKK